MILSLPGIAASAPDHAVGAPLRTRPLAGLAARGISFERADHGDFACDCDQRVAGVALPVAWAHRAKNTLAPVLKRLAILRLWGPSQLQPCWHQGGCRVGGIQAVLPPGRSNSKQARLGPIPAVGPRAQALLREAGRGDVVITALTAPCAAADA